MFYNDARMPTIHELRVCTLWQRQRHDGGGFAPAWAVMTCLPISIVFHFFMGGLETADPRKHSHFVKVASGDAILVRTKTKLEG